MRTILVAFAFFAVTACASEEAVENNTSLAEQSEATVEPQAMSVAGMTFEVEDEPGIDRTEFGTDGTFTDTFEGQVRRRGTYEERADGQLCFTYMGGENVMPEEVTECWTMDGPPNEEGWARSTRVSDGLTIRARPVTE